MTTTKNFLNSQLEGIAKIAWWFPGVSYAYRQSSIEKIHGGHPPFFMILGFL